MDKREFLSLVDKVLSGKASIQEEELLVRYYESFQQSSEWNTFLLESPEIIEERLLQRIQDSINTEDDTKTVRLARTRWRRAMPVLACIFLIAIGVYLFREGFQKWSGPVRMQQIATLEGQRKFIQLPDSSKIWLEAGSSLKYPEDFKGNTREIYLSGEAFFEVAKNPEKPFIIHTGKLNTSVLGTSFDIRAYPANNSEVVVVTGRVMVMVEMDNRKADEKTATGGQVILMPNQKVTFDSASQQLSKVEEPNASDYLERRKGMYIYKGTKIKEVIDDLQHLYGVQIRIKDNMKNCTFYGDFDVNKGVEKALSIIAITLNADVKKDPKQKGYIISGEGCQ